LTNQVQDIAELSELHRMLRQVSAVKATDADVHWAKQRVLNGAPLTDLEARRIRVAHARIFPIAKMRSGQLVVDSLRDDDETDDTRPTRALRPRRGMMVIP